MKLVLVNRTERLGAWIGRVPNKPTLEPVEFAVLLLVAEPPKGHGVDANPRTILANAGRAYGLAVLP